MPLYQEEPVMAILMGYHRLAQLIGQVRRYKVGPGRMMDTTMCLRTTVRICLVIVYSLPLASDDILSLFDGWLLSLLFCKPIYGNDLVSPSRIL